VAGDLERALDLGERVTVLLRGSQTAPPAHFRAVWPLLLALRHRSEAAGVLDELGQPGLGVNRGARAWLAMARAVLSGRGDPVLASELAAGADAQLAALPLWRSLARRLAAEAAAADGWAVPAHWMGEAEAWLSAHGYGPAAADSRAWRQDRPAAVRLVYAPSRSTSRRCCVRQPPSPAPSWPAWPPLRSRPNHELRSPADVPRGRSPHDERHTEPGGDHGISIDAGPAVGCRGRGLGRPSRADRSPAVRKGLRRRRRRIGHPTARRRLRVRPGPAARGQAGSHRRRP
jgi:hypothetical protein